MDPSLLNHYETDLQRLREAFAEFAREFRSAAGRLHLSDDPRHLTRDPYVNMLLQGNAYLSAEVRQLMDAEFPKFTQGLLQVLFPHFLCPTPSMGLVGFKPTPGDQTLIKGFTIPRHTLLRGQMAKGDQTACMFRTAHDVDLWPVRIAEAGYFSSRSLDTLGLPRGLPAKSAIRFRLMTLGGIKFGQIGDAAGGRPFERLVFHVRDDGKGPERGPGRIASAILEQVLSKTCAVVAQHGSAHPRQSKTLSSTVVQRVGFLPQESLLPDESRSFSGFRLLREYFALPDRFFFFALGGLRQVFKTCPEDTLDLILVFSEENTHLEAGEMGSSNQSIAGVDRFCLNVTPVVNLFEREFDRATVSPGSHQYEVMPDRGAASDYEVYSVSKVTGYGTEPGDRREYLPLFAASSSDESLGPGYLLYRTPRRSSTEQSQSGRVSDYAGTETFISLGEPGHSPLDSPVRELGFRGLCTNGGLPQFMPRSIGGTDFIPVDLSGPFEPEIRCLTGPTVPADARLGDASLWELIRHLTINYLSLGEGGERKAAAALQAALEMYFDSRRSALKRQVDGLQCLSVSPVVSRIPIPGPIVFGRGVEVSLEFDDEAFSGSSVFLLGLVLSEFFNRYVSINSFAQTVIRTRQRGTVTRWKANIGTRWPL